MICPHCGNNIPRNADICSQCGKPTQFSLKFNYRPSNAPIGSNSYGSIEHSANDTRDVSTDPTEIVRMISKALPSNHTIQLWLYKYIGISLLAIILCFLVSLFVFSSSNHRMEQIVQSLRPASTIEPTIAPSPSPVQQPLSVQILFDKNIPEYVKEDQVKNFPNSKIKTEKTPLNLDAEPNLEGYIFTGWNTREDGKGVSFPRNSIIDFNTDSGVLVLFAQWMRIGADNTIIHFEANLPESNSALNLMNMPDDIKKLPNEPISLIQSPTLSRYSFVEWNTRKDGTGLSIKVGGTLDINLDVDTLTFYAQWDINN